MDLKKIVDDHSIVLDFTVEDVRFKRLILDVLSRIPDKYEDEFPSFSIYEGDSSFGAHVNDFAITFDPEKLVDMSDNEEIVLVGIIAHEIAHIFCGHEGSTGDLSEDHEADDVARSWGFESEVNAMREKLGPATMI